VPRYEIESGEIMAKLTLSDVSSGYASEVLINANNALIEAALENTLSRDGTTPNAMSADLDMGTNRIVNLDAPVNSNDAVRLVDINSYLDVTGTGAPSVTGNANKYLGTDGSVISWSFPDAAYVTSTAYGNLAATDVQSALEELDDEKAGIALNNTFTGNNTVGGTFGVTGATTLSSTLAVSGVTTLSGALTMSGKSVYHDNASVAAAAATSDIWTTGNYVTLTGSAVTFTDFADAPQAGVEVELYCNAEHIFTNNANLVIDGGEDFYAQVGDRVRVRARSTTVFDLTPVKAQGTARSQYDSNEVYYETYFDSLDAFTVTETSGGTVTVNLGYLYASSPTASDVAAVTRQYVGNFTNSWYHTRRIKFKMLTGSGAVSIGCGDPSGEWMGLYYNTSTPGWYTQTGTSGTITSTYYGVIGPAVVEIVFTPDTDVKFYLDGALVATHTTNIPSYVTGGNENQILYLYTSYGTSSAACGITHFKYYQDAL
jgi:hypothetical protein